MDEARASNPRSALSDQEIARPEPTGPHSATFQSRLTRKRPQVQSQYRSPGQTQEATPAGKSSDVALDQLLTHGAAQRWNQDGPDDVDLGCDGPTRGHRVNAASGASPPTAAEH